MLIMLYSHDSYGLGHIRRSLEIAQHLSRSIPHASLIMLTGSMQAHAYALPDRMEYIKLPTLTKNAGGQYCSRLLPHTIDITLKLRQRIILESVRNLRPDILIVDKAPAGIRGELLPALQFLKTKSPSSRIILGMRDIEDHPDHVHAEWTKAGVVPLLKNTYHAICLYGSRTLYDPVKEYGLSRIVEKKFISCGYVGRTQRAISREHIRTELLLQTNRLVLVTPGGGDDGYPLLKTYVDMLRKHVASGRPTFDTLLVTGPLMSPEHRRRLQQAASPELALTVLEFTPRLYDYLASADLVVAMGGYNTIVEILTANQRGIIVPRVHPRLEQYLRAKYLAAHGLIDMIHPDQLTPRRLFTAIIQSLQRPRPPRLQDIGVALDGAAHVSRAVKQLYLESQHANVSKAPLRRPSGFQAAAIVRTS